MDLRSFRGRLTKISKQFARRDDGAVAILFGISAVVLVVFVGVAVDSSRVLHTSSRIQRALDTAAIAAAKKMDIEGISSSEIKDTAEKFFNQQIANQLIDNVGLANFNAAPNFNTGNVVLTVDVSLPLYFAAIAKASTNAAAPMSASATYKPSKLEIALVLDTTGSMCDSSPCTSGTKLDALKAAAKDMIDTLYNANPSHGAVRFSLVPYAASVNAGSYASAVSNGASVDDCVVERKGIHAYSNDAPGPGRYLQVSSDLDNPSYSCPPNAVVALREIGQSSQRTFLKSRIDAMVGRGGTAGHLGLAWGWYTLTPEWGSTLYNGITPRDYDLDGVTKAVVFMTDGMLNTAYNNGGESYVWPDAATQDPTKPGSSANQALLLCDKMRNPAASDERIKVYTVAFQAPEDAKTLLKQCSGETNFYTADNADDLTAAFEDIAKQLSKLRVTS